MTSRGEPTRRMFEAFFREEDGAVTVEAVLWIPFFFLVLFMLIDASMAFHNQTTVTRILQSANRNMSIGRFDTTVETQDFVLSHLAPLSSKVTASTSVTAGLITTTATIPIADIQMIGTIPGTGELTVTASHLMEF